MAPAHSVLNTQTHTWNLKYLLVFLYEALHTYFPREFLVTWRKLLAVDSLQTEFMCVFRYVRHISMKVNIYIYIYIYIYRSSLLLMVYFMQSYLIKTDHFNTTPESYFSTLFLWIRKEFKHQSGGAGWGCVPCGWAFLLLDLVLNLPVLIRVA